MNQSLFSNFLNNYANVRLADLEMILANTKKVTVKKGDFLLRQGEICKYSFFVETGLLKYYSIDEKGKIHVLQFAPEGWFVTDRESVFCHQASLFFIDAVEDSCVLQIEADFFDQFANSQPELVAINNKLLHNHIRQLQKRINLLLSASAEERYQDFVKTYPDLLLRVPQSMVASYLGIAPESLSRVRRELAERNFKK